MDSKTFRHELAQLLNAHSLENGSGTPDSILAEYLAECLHNFDRTMAAREKWYGRAVGETAPDREGSEANNSAS